MSNRLNEECVIRNNDDEEIYSLPENHGEHIASETWCSTNFIFLLPSCGFIASSSDVVVDLSQTPEDDLRRARAARGRLTN